MTGPAGAGFISLAFLAALDRSPQAAYPEYDEIRREARGRAAGPADPRAVGRYQAVMTEHGADWCARVLGRAVHAADLGLVSCTESEQLLIAHERGLDPAEPAWLTQWKAESAETVARREQARRDARQRDLDRWAAALATCQVPVTVRPNLNGRRYRSILAEALRHVVPDVDARSGRRRHAAGRGLCETARRARPLELGGPVGEPATCVACIRYAAEIKAAGE